MDKRKDQYAKDAEAWKSIGEFTKAKDYESQAKALDTDIRESRVKVMDQKRKDMEESMNVMRDVKDQDSLITALAAIQSQFGKGMRDKIEAQLPHRSVHVRAGMERSI